MRVSLYADPEAVSRDLPHAVDFMLGTSARIGETMACRWSDLDLAADVPTVTIRATSVFVKGSGTVIQEHPKTSASRRVVPLPAFVVRVLQLRWDERRHPDLVFPSARGGVRDPNNFRKGLRRMAEGPAIVGGVEQGGAGAGDGRADCGSRYAGRYALGRADPPVGDRGGACA